MLLTHDSRSSDAPGITWQLCKKIPLLNHRLNPKIDFVSYFQCDHDAKEETIIERLYLKRSIIVHGNQESLEKKLQMISKGDEVAFLRLLVRKIISYALKEPQLLRDLREC